VMTVDFSETLERLYAEGYRRFINLGPSDTLEKFIACSPIAKQVEVLGAAELYSDSGSLMAGSVA
jgi:malonyl CoA-acyl carrier protein transacylase